MNTPRVVVTGLGTVNPIGKIVPEFWNNVVAGKSGIGPITRFDATNFYVKCAGEINDFDPYAHMDPKVADRSSRAVHYGLAAAREAMAQAGIDMNRETPERVGVYVAYMTDSSYNLRQAEIVQRRGTRRMDPLFVARAGASAPAMQIGMDFQARGPNSSAHSLCTSGADAIATSMDFIRLGHADVMIAGGTDSCLSPVHMAGLDILGAVSREPDPAIACRPFDAERSGLVFGEGTGIIVLESLEHATARGAEILAELGGSGWSFDAADYTNDAAECKAYAMKFAMAQAGVSPGEVTYVNAHGVGTRLHDPLETQALKLAFGDHAYNLAVSSTKPMTGHAVTASGAIKAIACIMTLVAGVVHPTINYLTPDPECDLDYVPNTARDSNVDVCLSNSFGLGGQNCCLVFRKFRG